MTKNMKAFLDMLAHSEIGPELLAISDNGYNVNVGSTPSHPILFDSYAAHPRKYIATVNSDAAGRYQEMGQYWEHYRRQLGLPDFGKDSQDRWAIQLINECRAVDLIESGHFEEAVHACKSRWASLPGAGYGQHENNMADLRAVYVKAGGGIAGVPRDVSIGARGSMVRLLQTTLAKKGYPVGLTDGDFGGKTDFALKSFQAANNIPATGIADAATWKAMGV